MVPEDDFFFKLGRMVAPKVRKGQWIWSSLTGSSEEALDAEYQAGRDLAREFDAGVALDDDPHRRKLADRIAEQLSVKLTNKQRRWRVAVMKGPEPGAFALPGGFLYVTQPLFELCAYDDDELACVIGHEMGHVVRGHAMERITTQALATAASRAVPSPTGAVAGWLIQAGVALFHSTHSQDRELEADEFGARLAAASGYDPRGAIRVLERLKSLTHDGGLPLAEYFASHPPLEIRIENLRRLIRVKS